MDDKDYIYLVGRKKGMYKTAGYSVYPAGIENILIRHPKVLMATVIESLIKYMERLESHL